MATRPSQGTQEISYSNREADYWYPEAFAYTLVSSLIGLEILELRQDKVTIQLPVRWGLDSSLSTRHIGASKYDCMLAAKEDLVQGLSWPKVA